MNHKFSIVIGLVVLTLLPLSIRAHKPSDSYLTIIIDGSTIHGQWDIALRDLEHAIGLDANHNGNITWGEVRAQHHNIAAYALARLTVSRNDITCATQPQKHLVDHHSDGAYAFLKFFIICPQAAGVLRLTYNMLFEFDQLHRGLLRVVQQGQTQTFIFGPKNRSFTTSRSTASFLVEFQRFGIEGVWHIWMGYDHLLFLLSLLLPSVLFWEGSRWNGVPYFGLAFWSVVKIVTAFTLAHSLTLTMAVFQIISLPSRLVETSIAASVLIAALHNIYPILIQRVWVVAFGFGLIHGLGFASTLLDLGLMGQSVLPALGGFNVGVEIGQLAIVAPFLVLAYGARNFWWYPALILRFGSFLIAFVALVWLVERGLNINLGLKPW